MNKFKKDFKFANYNNFNCNLVKYLNIYFRTTLKLAEITTSQPYQYKIFINQCNGYIGSQLIYKLRNDD
jgi:hypothetical protein